MYLSIATSDPEATFTLRNSSNIKYAAECSPSNFVTLDPVAARSDLCHSPLFYEKSAAEQRCAMVAFSGASGIDLTHVLPCDTAAGTTNDTLCHTLFVNETYVDLVTHILCGCNVHSLSLLGRMDDLNYALQDVFLLIRSLFVSFFVSSLLLISVLVSRGQCEWRFHNFSLRERPWKFRVSEREDSTGLDQCDSKIRAIQRSSSDSPSSSSQPAAGSWILC